MLRIRQVRQIRTALEYFYPVAKNKLLRKSDQRTLIYIAPRRFASATSADIRVKRRDRCHSVPHDDVGSEIPHRGL